MDRLFNDLNEVTGRIKAESVHLTDFPEVDESLIDKDLEDRMELAQRISSMVLSLRKKNNIRVRQPLNKIMIPVLNDHFRELVEAVKDLILSEVNVKTLEFITDESGILVKRIKPNFKSLGPKYGKLMKQISATIMQFGQDDIRMLEQKGEYRFTVDDQEVVLTPDDVEIITEDIPGWSVANQDHLTVALDLTITPELQEEGLARELVNRIQNIRKEKGFEVTDRIKLFLERNKETDKAFSNFGNYICSETLATLLFEDKLTGNHVEEFDLIDQIIVRLRIEKE